MCARARLRLPAARVRREPDAVPPPHTSPWVASLGEITTTEYDRPHLITRAIGDFSHDQLRLIIVDCNWMAAAGD